ncbi:MAG: TlpA disulfide reductase family protein [Gammaproteobacteria bacterium]|nr:TlpA disulfide reductase family protein [Gammaproteobacteria bacterium]
MYWKLGWIGLLCFVFVVFGCSAAPPKTFTISGEFIAIEKDEPEDTIGETDDSETSNAIQDESLDDSEKTETLDWSAATIVISYESTSDSGETETVELGSGQFVDGKVSFTGDIDQAIEVEIAARLGDDESLSATAWITPGGETVEFALVDYFDDFFNPDDHLVLVGASRRSRDEETKFTFKGNISDLDTDLADATFSVTGRVFEDGKAVTKTFGRVMPKDGSFLIESDIVEPSVVSFRMRGEHAISSGKAVVEPNSTITLSWRESAGELIPIADSGLHVELVESWHRSEEYLAAMDEYPLAILAWAESFRSSSDDDETEDGEDENAMPDTSEATEEMVSESTGDDEEDQPEEAEKLESSQTVAATEGCEHVELDGEVANSVVDMMDEPDGPAYMLVKHKMDDMRRDSLKNIANSADDPMYILLAMELGAYSSRSADRSDAFPIYDKLARVLDADLVSRRVTPRREDLQRFIDTEANDRTLVTGQKAPEFELADLEGEKVALSDVLAEKEIVLIDFWASWCAPCIATFPDLKRMYSDYHEDGFEIVAISIDSTFEDWEEGSEEHQLPWINIGEIEGWDGPVAGLYGVQAIPKGYLVDSKGCILEKDLDTESLEGLLASRYGPPPELEHQEAD